MIKYLVDRFQLVPRASEILIGIVTHFHSLHFLNLAKHGDRNHVNLDWNGDGNCDCNDSCHQNCVCDCNLYFPTRNSPELSEEENQIRMTKKVGTKNILSVCRMNTYNNHYYTCYNHNYNHFNNHHFHPKNVNSNQSPKPGQNHERSVAL